MKIFLGTDWSLLIVIAVRRVCRLVRSIAGLAP